LYCFFQVLSDSGVIMHLNHALARQCESAVRATTQVSGKMGNSPPCHSTIVTKRCTRDYVLDI